MVKIIFNIRHWLFAISFFCGLFVLIFGFESEMTNQLIQESLFENDLKIGQILHLSNITKSTSGSVCSLYLYKSEVESGVPGSNRINALLKDNGCSSDEVS